VDAVDGGRGVIPGTEESELSVRPVFHQLEPHVKAHVIMAFLGYALLVTLTHLLKRRPGIVRKPSAVREVPAPGGVADEARE
jgi:hypothetical protein